MTSPSLRNPKLGGLSQNSPGAVAFVDGSYRAHPLGPERAFYPMSAVTFAKDQLDHARRPGQDDRAQAVFVFLVASDFADPGTYFDPARDEGCEPVAPLPVMATEAGRASRSTIRSPPRTAELGRVRIGEPRPALRDQAHPGRVQTARRSGGSSHAMGIREWVRTKASPYMGTVTSPPRTESPALGHCS